MRAVLGLLAALAAASAVFALSAGQALAGAVRCGDVITQDTKLDSNLHCGDYGIFVGGSGGVTLDLNGHTVSAHITVIGVLRDAGSAVIENGTARGGVLGVQLFGGTARHMLITGNEVGVDIAHASGTVVRSTIRGNSFGGIGVGRGALNASHDIISNNGNYGVRLVESTATLDYNRIVRNGQNGIQIPDRAGIEAAHNIVSANGADGVLAGPFVSGTLTDNRIDRNGSDGVHVTDLDPRLTISGNRTWFNHNLGIDAPEGTPGSNNHAKHNGNPAQCVPASLCNRLKP